MAVVILRPDVVESDTSGWTAVDAADLLTALSDDSDDSWGVSGSGSNNPLVLRFEPLDLPSGARVRRVRVCWRASANSGTPAPYHSAMWNEVQQVEWGGANRTATGTWPIGMSSAWVTSVGGASWTKALVDATLATFTASSVAMRMYDMWLEVEVDEKPVVNITAPTGTVTDTSRPTIAWDYSDDLEPQEAYLAQVWDWSVPALVWSSGFVLSSASSVRIPFGLPNGTYEARVTVRQVWPGTGSFTSDTDVQEFTIDVEAPDPPTIDVTPEPDLLRARIDVAAVGEVDTDGIDVEYAVDCVAGEWRPVLGGTGLELDDGEATVWDVEWEPAPAETVYRARAFKIVDEEPLYSAWAEASPIEVPLAGARVAKNPLNPELSFVLPVALPGHSADRPHRVQVHRPLGRTTAVVTRDVAGATDDRLTLRARSIDEFHQIDAFLGSGDVWLLQTAWGESRYVQITSAGWDQPDWDGVHHRTATVALVEVSRPPDPDAV